VEPSAGVIFVQVKQDRWHRTDEMTTLTGETLRLFQDFEWERSLLGPVADWQPEMHVVVRTVLDSAFPICTFWGEEGIQIYNDAFVGMFAVAHPRSFGAPLSHGWNEIRSLLSPAIEHVRATGEALRFHKTMLPLTRKRQPEECYFDLSYSAVRSLDEEIIGVMLVAMENTETVVTERRKPVTELWPVAVESHAGIYAQLRNMLVSNHMDARCAALFAIDRKSGRPDEQIWSIRLDTTSRHALRVFLESALPVRRGDSFLYLEMPILSGSGGIACIIPVRSKEGDTMAVLVIMPDRLVPIERSHAAFVNFLTDRLTNVIRNSETRRQELGSVKQRLEHRNELYRFLFENIGDAVFYSTTEGGSSSSEVVIAANPQASALTGYEPRELIGLSWDSLFSTSDQEASANSGKRRQSRSLFGELTIRTKSTGSLRGEFTTKLVSGPDEEVRAITVVRDLTARLIRERGQEERARLQTMVQLTGGVAHDFNNFLTVVLGSLDVLGATRRQSSTHRQAVENARLASERAASLTNQLLSYSRRQPLQAKATDIHELMAEVELLIRSSLGEISQLVFEFGENLPPCMLDSTQMTSAMLNLATNARDAMPGGGTFTMRTGLVEAEEPISYNVDHVLAPGTYVSVSFEDTGGGIPEELRTRIFEPFFTTKRIGTGLGLSMVQGFIRQSGGEARALSAPGGGTCIELLIPASDYLDAADSKPISLKAEGQLVLLVEDNEMVRSQTEQMLSRAGFSAVCAADASQALDLLPTMPNLEIVMTDLMMPGDMSGLDLADEIKARNPGLSIVLTTGRDPKDELPPRARSAYRILRKPYSQRTLSEGLLRELMSRRKRAS
jgi:PAS domain S-box-containing protein